MRTYILKFIDHVYFGPTVDTRNGTYSFVLIRLVEYTLEYYFNIYVETCSFDERLNGYKEPLKIELRENILKFQLCGFYVSTC